MKLTRKEMENLSDEIKVLIKKNYFPSNASVTDMQFCMGVAKQFDLNPLRNEIYFIERKARVNGQWVSKVSPMIGRDGFLSIAHKTGKFVGMETTAEIKDVPYVRNGVWDTKQDLVATCKIWRKNADRPFVVDVNYSEYVQKRADGTPISMWADKPITMLKKVAESQCLRKAFSITGIYSEEELSDTVVTNNATNSNAANTDNEDINKVMSKKQEDKVETDKEQKENLVDIDEIMED